MKIKFGMAFSLIIGITVLLTGCKDDNLNKQEIINLSGIDWYDTSVTLFDIDENMKEHINVGMVPVGESCTIKSIYPYFCIFAKDINGETVISKRLGFGNDKTVTVGKKDLE
jgi:hypothetical protein